MSTLILLAALTLGQQTATGNSAPVYQVYLVRNEYNQYQYIYVPITVIQQRPDPWAQVEVDVFRWALEPRRESYRARRGRFFFWQ